MAGNRQQRSDAGPRNSKKRKSRANELKSGNDGPPPTKIYFQESAQKSNKYQNVAAAATSPMVQPQIATEGDDDLNNFTDVFFDEELDEKLIELEKEKEKELKEIDNTYREVKDLLFKKSELLQENLKYLNEEKKRRMQNLLDETYNHFSQRYNIRETTLHELAENEEPVDLQVAKNLIVKMSYSEKDGVKEVEIEQVTLPDCLMATPRASQSNSSKATTTRRPKQSSSTPISKK
ncbi:unnamed protein product [Dimorphilus gyrociliatus]|uniref:Uncharacterized protein n=1 Tax=Dimorphilus gyrociliatus TaxID=2664684 RepID=A0A7I8VFZ7_9ANNE|nr:unnamed protein product [Dimorphilus gyrociliatus]